MKKFAALLMTVLLTLGVVSLTACGDKQEQAPASEPSVETEAEVTADNDLAPASMYTAGQNVNTVATPDSVAPSITGEISASDGLEVTAIPIERDNYDPDLVMIFTNNTGKACDIYLTVDFLDEDGNVLENVEEDALDAVPQSAAVPVCWGLSSLGTTFAGYRVKAETKDVNSDFYSVIDDQVKFDYQKNDDSVTFTVTNNADEVAHWVNTYVLFIKDGKLADYSFETCGGKEITEIQPGETVTTEVTPYIDGGFDDVMVFVHGQGY